MGHLGEYLYFLPGPLPAGVYSATIYLDSSASLAFESFATALVWRRDGGPDQTLYAATVEISDGGEGMIGFDAGLAAVPASCGDLLVLQVTQETDGGDIYLAYPTLSVP